MKVTGVLCARARVEEKQIIAALGGRGLVAMPVPPAACPLPPGPASGSVSMLGGFLDATTGETIQQPLAAIVDRTANRAVPMAILPLLRMQGIRTVDAGLAATGTRLQVASALAEAGVPRPACLAGFSEATGLVATNQLGYPSTLLGMTAGEATTTLHDADTADAVIEHRVVLGQDAEAIILIQAGAPRTEDLTTVHVVGGRAIAWDGTACRDDGIALAERTALVVGASLVAVQVARAGGQHVVWDVLPVAEFRHATTLGDRSVAGAIADLCHDLSGDDEVHGLVSTCGSEAGAGQAGWERTVTRGYAVSA